jgi:hypothetical protein
VARDDERAAGVGVGAAVGERLAFEPAAQEAGHEGVAGAEDVEHLDREARALQARPRCRRDRVLEDDAAHRPALDDERRRGELAQAAQRGEGVAGAAGDADLLLGADEQVAVGDDPCSTALTRSEAT